MRKSILLLVVFLTLLACKETIIEKVEDHYQDNTPKVVGVYKVNGNDTLKIEEKTYFENGKIKIQGAIKNNVREGKWEAFFDDGILQSIGMFKNGVRHGEAKVYYHNKQLMYEGMYEHGKESGKWKFYNEQGELVNEEDFNKGS